MIVHVVAFESTSSGGIEWRVSLDHANAVFDAMVRRFPDHEVNLFTIDDLEDGLTPEQITFECDATMWHRDYKPLRSHNFGASLVKEN
jgi:hypothetical protein